MNLEAALALVSAAAGGAATEAGRHAWVSLQSLTRRLAGGTGLQPVDPADDAGVRELTGRLAERAHSDDEFAAELRQWAEQHRTTLTVHQTRAENVETVENVENTVSGDAKVQNLLQAGSIHGDIHFGPSPRAGESGS